MAEDLGQEDVVGLVLGFKLVAADGSVGAAEVAGFPGFVQRAESGGNVLGQLRAGGGVDGIGTREGFQGPELIESADDLFWIGQNGNRVRLEAGAGGVAGFELAVEDECEEGEFPGRQTEAGAKEDLGRPASGERHQAHPFFEIAAAGQQVDGFFYEGLRIQRDQVGLVLVDALVVSRVERPGFLRRQSEVGKALAGTHLSGAQDEVVRVDLADRVAVLGEIEFDGGRGEPLFESADLGLADTAEFL